MRLLKRTAWIVGFLCGAALLALFLRKLDLSTLTQLPRAFWVRQITVIVLFQLGIIMLHSLQWGILLAAAGIRTHPLRILGARFGGAAVSILSPALSVGGEVVRAALVKKKETDPRRLAATVALDKYVELSTRLPFVAAGVLLLAFRLKRVSALLLIGGGLFTSVVLLGTLFFIFSVVRPSAVLSLVDRIARMLERIGAQFAGSFRRGAIAFLSSLAPGPRSHLLAVFLIGAGASALELGQIAVLLTALGLHGIEGAPVVLAVSVLGGISAVVPGNVGGMEALNILAFSLIGGAAASGLSYSLVLRAGQIVVIGVGFAYMLKRKLRKDEAAPLIRPSVEMNEGQRCCS